MSVAATQKAPSRRIFSGLFGRKKGWEKPWFSLGKPWKTGDFPGKTRDFNDFVGLFWMMIVMIIG